MMQTRIWLGLAAIAVAGGVSAAVLLQTNNAGKEPLPQPITSISPDPSASPNISSPSPTTAPTSTPIANQQVQVYWLGTREKRFVAVPVTIKVDGNKESALQAALKAAINPPSDKPNLYSAIPKKTKILGLTIKGREIHLNLSKEFTSGGGSSSMIGRVVQVLYTATTLEPESKLYLSVEGKLLSFLGGEGLEVPQPLTRARFPLEF